MQREISFKVSKINSYPILVLTILTILFHWNSQTSLLTDIKGSRDRYISGNGDTFLGGISAVFYGNIPDNFITWWQYLLLGQTFITALGLYLIFFDRADTNSKLTTLAKIFFCYLVLNLGVSQSRDGLMIACSTLTIGLIKKVPSSNLKFVGLVFIFVFTFSFRPWLAFAFFPLILFILKGRFKISNLKVIFITILIVVLPTLTEISISNFWNIKSGFPQQTVMIHDLGSTYCLSSTQESREISYKALVMLASSEENLDHFCNFYKPTTWQSTTSENFTDPNLSLLSPPINPIRAGDYRGYKNLERAWLNLIRNDPKTYIQNHLYFFTQVLVGGDSTSSDISNSLAKLGKNFDLISLLNLLGSIYNLFWKLVLMTYLLTPTFIFFLQIAFLYLKKNLVLVPLNFQFNLLFLLWIGITSIGFVSDNGRYTYLPALLIIGNYVYQARYLRSR